MARQATSAQALESFKSSTSATAVRNALKDLVLAIKRERKQSRAVNTALQDFFSSFLHLDPRITEAEALGDLESFLGGFNERQLGILVEILYKAGAIPIIRAMREAGRLPKTLEAVLERTLPNLVSVIRPHESRPDSYQNEAAIIEECARQSGISVVPLKHEPVRPIVKSGGAGSGIAPVVDARDGSAEASASPQFRPRVMHVKNALLASGISADSVKLYVKKPNGSECTKPYHVLEIAPQPGDDEHKTFIFVSNWNGNPAYVLKLPKDTPDPDFLTGDISREDLQSRGAYRISRRNFGYGEGTREKWLAFIVKHIFLPTDKLPPPFYPQRLGKGAWLSNRAHLKDAFQRAVCSKIESLSSDIVGKIKLNDDGTLNLDSLARAVIPSAKDMIIAEGTEIHGLVWNRAILTLYHGNLGEDWPKGGGLKDLFKHLVEHDENFRVAIEAAIARSILTGKSLPRPETP